MYSGVLTRENKNSAFSFDYKTGASDDCPTFHVIANGCVGMRTSVKQSPSRAV